MYQYETHLHTSPVSACASVGVKETLESYKAMGYDGVFLTNHFLDGNIGISHRRSYEEKIDFYFSDYEAALAVGKEIGLKVFLGVEISYDGTDFLIYGLDKAWFLAHPEIMDLPMREKLAYYKEHGAYIVHAHPYREDWYIDHIRLYPNSIHAVEVINANRPELQNKMARLYAEAYGFQMTAGTDNHVGGKQKKFAGVMTDTPITSVEDYIQRVKNGEIELFERTV